MDTGKAILGMLAGLAAGAVLGVLFAPEKGSSTRKVITKKGEDLADALNDKIDQRFEELINTMTGKMGKPKQKNDGAELRKTEMV
jgi:gas vesicle protein